MGGKNKFDLIEEDIIVIHRYNTPAIILLVKKAKPKLTNSSINLFYYSLYDETRATF